MTTEDVKQILSNHSDRILVLTALSSVNLSDEEYDVLIFRYMRGLTQEKTAEKMDEIMSVNKVFTLQQRALNKTAKMWGKLILADILLKTL